MDPYLRPAPPDGRNSKPCPPGQVAEPAGLWEGEHKEIVYDPSEHEVLIVRGNVAEALDSGLTKTGWQRQHEDGATHLWVRDRVEAARQAFAAATPTDAGRSLGR